jgi:hypothetical protein
MSWASSRKNSRREDIAYCLLGLFGLNMPLLYGEGSNAFLRLQQEVIRNSDDETIFAWPNPDPKNGDGQSFNQTGYSGLLAKSPRCFSDADDLIRFSHFYGVSEAHRFFALARPPYGMTNKGLQFQSGLLNELTPARRSVRSFLPLNCQRAGDRFSDRLRDQARCLAIEMS